MKISKSNFDFWLFGRGHYKVTYKSHKRATEFSKVITDMELIDLTKNTEHPTLRNLNQLKRACKS